MTDQELRELVAGNAIAIDKIAKEAEKRNKEAEKEMKRSREEAEKEMKELRELLEETGKQLKETEKILKGMGVTQGDISEDLIFDNFGNVFKEIGEEINSLERNIKLYDKGKIKGEFDIIGVNGSKVFIGETKTKLKKEHVDKLIDKQIPTFRKYDRRHAGMKVFGVVGARVVPEKVKQYAKKRGLYIVKEYNNGNARILKESLKTVKSL